MLDPITATLLAVWIIGRYTRDSIAVARGAESVRDADREARHDPNAVAAHERRREYNGPTVRQALSSRIADWIMAPEDRQARREEKRQRRAEKSPPLLWLVITKWWLDIVEEWDYRREEKRLEKLNERRQREGLPVIDVEAEVAAENEVVEHWCAECDRRPVNAPGEVCPACGAADDAATRRLCSTCSVRLYDFEPGPTCASCDVDPQPAGTSPRSFPCARRCGHTNPYPDTICAYCVVAEDQPRCWGCSFTPVARHGTFCDACMASASRPSCDSCQLREVDQDGQLCAQCAAGEVDHDAGEPVHRCARCRTTPVSIAGWICFPCSDAVLTTDTDPRWDEFRPPHLRTGVCIHCGSRPVAADQEFTCTACAAHIADLLATGQTCTDRAHGGPWCTACGAAQVPEFGDPCPACTPETPEPAPAPENHQEGTTPVTTTENIDLNSDVHEAGGALAYVQANDTWLDKVGQQFEVLANNARAGKVTDAVGAVDRLRAAIADCRGLVQQDIAKHEKHVAAKNAMGQNRDSAGISEGTYLGDQT